MADEYQLRDTARGLVVDTAALQAVDALAAAGLRCLVLRGPAIFALLYDTSEQRPYGDIDLLVDPQRFAAAEDALRGSGMLESPVEAAHPGGRPPHAHTWQARLGGAVDLHRTIIGVHTSPADAWRVLTREIEVVELGGRPVPAPSVPARAVIIALHAAHHVDDQSHVVRDLERAVARLGRDVWAAAFDLARELDAVDACARGVALSVGGRELLSELGVPEPSGPADEPLGERSYHVAQGVDWLLETPGIGAKLALVRRRLLPSPRTLRQRSALARKGAPGLALAYVLRALDAVRFVPAAISVARRRKR